MSCVPLKNESSTNVRLNCIGKVRLTRNEIRAAQLPIYFTKDS